MSVAAVQFRLLMLIQNGSTCELPLGILSPRRVAEGLATRGIGRPLTRDASESLVSRVPTNFVMKAEVLELEGCSRSQRAMVDGTEAQTTQRPLESGEMTYLFLVAVAAGPLACVVLLYQSCKKVLATWCRRPRINLQRAAQARQTDVVKFV